jgi:peptidoglycan hydrolase-like protein with peptidoglycan-binding domain
MRLLGGVFAVFLTAFAAAAQNDHPSPPGVTAKPAAPVTKFRKPGIRAATLRARATARRSHAGIPTPDPNASEAGTVRTAAAAARKRASTSPAPGREASMPLADRLALQLDLAWSGDYNGLINGEANEKTTAAIKAFQRNRKFKETGALNTQERALLAASAKAKQAQVGWSMVDDAATGARLGIPAKQVPNKSQSKTGSRWSSAQGQVQVETFRIREPGTTLASVYEQQKKEPTTRRLDVNVLRGDFFILSGMQNLKKFYVRAEFKDGEVRAMTVLYDQATENIMDPVAVVMASAFSAFPNVTGVAQIGSAPKRKVEYGTGIIVSGAGHILTDRALTDGCNVIVVSGYGDADREAEDKKTDLALLRVYGAPDLVSAAFANDSAKGPDMTLLGIADPQSQGGGGAISAVTARLRDDALEPAPQLGFSGAAVLDGQSRFIGMVELKTPVIATVGASTAQPQATIVPASIIRAFLEAQKVPAATLRSGLDSAKASVVRVICVRK